MEWHRKRRIITITFVAGIGLLAAMVLTAAFLNAQLGALAVRMQQAHHESDIAGELEAGLVDTESGLRGFVIAGDPIYLADFYKGRGTAAAAQRELAADPAFANWAAPDKPSKTLGPLLAEYEALVEEILTTARARDLDAARQRLGAQDSEPVLDRIRAIIEYNIDTLEAESEQARRETDVMAGRYSTLVLVTPALTILFSIIQYVLFRNEIASRGAVEQTLRQRNTDRKAIAELSAALQLSGSRAEAYRIFEGYARKILPEVAGAFYVFAASRDQLSLVARWNDTGVALNFSANLYPADCWGLRQGGQHAGDTGHADQRSGKAELTPICCAHVESDGTGAYTCIPIVGRGQILGLLHLRGDALRDRAAAAALADKVERLVDQLSLSLTNIELRETLENMALRDGLTGLYNRRFLDEVLMHDLAKLKRDGKTAALLMIDVDHFKRFNDTHGHQAGDEALIRVAVTLRAAVRASDIACRYGGEEFLMVLRDCDAPEALAKAEAIREAVAATEIRAGGQALPRVTASIGMAMFPASAADPQQLIRRADAALYRARKPAATVSCWWNRRARLPLPRPQPCGWPDRPVDQLANVL
jgi:diguanylate cyclase (GGDEF)-like protein